MYEKLRGCIDALFEDAPKTAQTVELKEEMLQNLIDKYNELVSSGKSEEAAYNIAVAGVGDVSELVNGLHSQPEKRGSDDGKSMDRAQKSGLFIAIAVAMYILSIVPCIIFSQSNVLIGVCIMFVMIAAATCLLIYNGVANKPYVKKDSTVVEEFKEWNDRNSEKKSVFKAISSCLWAITVVVYLLISFTTGSWGITWVIFLISGAIESIIKAIIDLKR